MDSITIETTRLTLRPFTQRDARATAVNSQQPNVAYWMSDMVLKDEAAAASWIDWINEKCLASESFRVFAIERRGDRACIGLIGYAPKEKINHEVEILYAVADAYQGCGYATEAAKALVWYAFEKVGLGVLSAIIKPENHGSRKVIEKLGFIYGDTRKLPYDGTMTVFEYYRLYHIEHIPDSEWNFTCNTEEMAGFFDNRAEGYESHMLKYVTDMESYKRATFPIPESNSEISVLDLGCGTGLELGPMFERVPNARVTCIDLSEKMLEILKRKYASKARQIKTICGSYIDWEYPKVLLTT